jgi:Phosphoribosyl transferase domain
MKVVSCFSLLIGSEGWQDAHHSVKQFVDALKGRVPSGYAYVRLFPGAPRRRLDYLNTRDAVEWFGEMASSIVAAELGTDRGVVLVPIPDSRSVIETSRSRTVSLADATAARLPAATVRDVLRFDQVMHSAHANQGARDAPSLFLHMRLCESLAGGPRFVLIDDVVTTGGHLAAAAATLREQGVEVQLAVCAASAERLPRADPFERVTRAVPDYRPASAAEADWTCSAR